jgi:predicted SnoaL-like aldol condensation-catalyzing enzyme
MEENLGEIFASHIDNARFEEAGELIAEECVYRHENTVHKGRVGIIAMYRELQKGMKPHFDEINYESEVEVIDGETCKVHYFDEYRKGDRTHRTRTEEIMKFEDGKIISIEQISNHGEAMAFRKFFQETR